MHYNPFDPKRKVHPDYVHGIYFIIIAFKDQEDHVQRNDGIVINLINSYLLYHTHVYGLCKHTALILLVIIT